MVCVTSSDDSDQIVEKLPPERLLAADRLGPIRAGIRCMGSIETLQQYLAHETKHRNRTQVQAAIRMRAQQLRDTPSDEGDGETNPIL